MEGTVISCASASASARGSFGGTKRAVSAVISAIAPTSLATIASPALIASITASGNASRADGCAKMS